MRCPACGTDDDKVVDSRAADEGAAVRRRRECLACGARFTTFERIEEAPLVVLKRSGDAEPFRRDKVVAGVVAAAKNRPITAEAVDALAADVEEALRLDGGQVSTQRVGYEVLERLRDVDEIAYLRFASVYKNFDDLDDVQRELGLLTKTTAPKPH